ncbi:cytochrome P450 9e2-like [Belonocnema kinseyi]|uniref:cytochrome P450 9e2-like n=1 Tax=Belonocnema kinseyi TaxID=2817044 RepID=UPI00143D9177|nr:cytochrome P450 9e2-like [Belonocnema kinseyi]
MASTILLLLTFFVGAIGAIILLYRQMNFWSRRGIPHLKPLPIIGNNLSMFFGRTSITEFVTNIYDSFPDAKYFGIMGFQTPVAVLRDPELIKETCVKNFDYFLNHQSFLTEEMDPLFGKNVFSLKGDRWKVMRNTLSPCFTGAKMKFMFEIIAKCSRDFVQYFINHPDEATSIDTKDAFTRYTNDVIATAAFGISVNSMKDRENEFYLRGKDATSFRGIWRMLKFFGFLACPKIMKLIGVTFFSRATYRFFAAVIHDAVKTREENNIIRPDMLQLLIEAKVKDNRVEMSIDDITAQAFIFFFAGFDPSSTLMCFVAHELAVNPEIQEKLRNEVDILTKHESSDISYETLSQMKYMDMVISEALRKYPPTAATDRECVKKFTLPKPTPDSVEYTAEPKTVIWIPIYALHHDPKYFPDPEKFDPERFSDENKSKINPYTYVPFGIGPRKCIGNRFILLETKILFVHILQHFILEKCEKTRHPVEFEKIINVAIKGGSWVKFTKRNS